MRKILLLLLLSRICFAQDINYDKVIVPDATASADMGEKLVRLAWVNYPLNGTFDRRISIAQKNVNIAKWSWADNLRFFYNFNDRTLQRLMNDDNGENTLTQPTYGLGISVNLGSIVSVPARTKIAKENVGVEEANKNAQKLQIRAEVLTLYQKYQLSLNLLKIRTQSVEDSYSTYVLISERFKKGEATLEEFNQSLNQYSGSMEAKLTAESDVVMYRTAIEEYIGISLDEVK